MKPWGMIYIQKLITMGIQLLNTFFKKQKCTSIKEISLKQLEGKKIAVDISIYLYRYKKQDALIEHIFTMCSILRHYNIHPVFIFDGKASAEKKITIMERSSRREQAKKSLQHYQHQLQTATGDEKGVLHSKIEQVKKDIVKLSLKDIYAAKQLLDLYGLPWIHAKGEADEVCAALVLSNMVYACLSEDTDMFAYGVPRVLKYFSLIHHRCVIYETKEIFRHLGLELEDFQHLCIISGTDYNKRMGNIFTFYNLYMEEYKSTDTSKGFLQWLGGKYISMQNYYRVQEIANHYRITPSEILQQYKYIPIRNGFIQMNKLKIFLEKYNFMFC